MYYYYYYGLRLAGGVVYNNKKFNLKKNRSIRSAAILQPVTCDRQRIKNADIIRLRKEYVGRL